MRLQVVGLVARVTVSRAEICKFRKQWPTSGLRARAMTFDFSIDHGRLLRAAGQGKYSGPELIALAEDAQLWAAKRIPSMAVAG